MFEMKPTIDVGTLEDMLNEAYPEVAEMYDFLASVMFGEEYNNYSYKRYNYRSIEEFCNLPWQNEEHLFVENRLKTLLQELLPEYDEVLVDVSW